MVHLTLDLCSVFERLSVDCDLDKTTVQYCLRRLRAEGLKFWTITLPKLAKSVLNSIELGRFDPARDELTEFAWKGRSLRYFRSLLGNIFSLKTGDLLPNPSGSSLRSLRIVLEYSYKLALDFDEKVLKNAEATYEATHTENALHSIERTHLEKLRAFAETNYPSLFKASPDFILSHGPRFGPGSVILPGSEPLPFYLWKQQPDSRIGTCSLEARPYSGYFKPYPSAPGRIKLVKAEKRCQVIFVPKDSRGPRVISKESPHIIRAQMAFFKWAVSVLPKDTKGRIQFLDQLIFRELARESSVTRRRATMDMKEASERVVFRYLRHVCRNAPGISFFFRNFRATRYKLPSQKVGELTSLAGMGSGLTFPMLAFWIHLNVCHEVCSTYRLPFKTVCSEVYVYGDDLIVPREWFDVASRALTRVGMRINASKSYKDGPFRESCGGDYLAGIECAPTRLRLNNAGLPLKTEASTSLVIRAEECKSTSNLIVALSAHAQELRQAALNNAADYYETVLQSVIPMPYVGLGSPVLGKLTDDSNKIVKQGSLDVSNGTYTVRGVTSSAVNAKFGRSRGSQCPYKYMKPFLASRASNLLADASRGTAFGEVPIPRKLKLKFGNHSVTELLPVVGSGFNVLL